MTAPLVSVTGISKMFGLVRALDELSLELQPGVTGLLGPNGSGKSTLLKLIAGQLKPDTGQVRVFGRDPFRDPEVFSGLGLCPEQDKFYEDLTGETFVSTLCRMHGMPPREAKDRARHALARVGMEQHGTKRIASMSRGMRQRTKIAQAIVHDPRVVLLDEPLTGADPVARRDLIDLVEKLGAEGRCVVVSSHVLHEVEAMTHRVVLIRFGRLRARGDIMRLRALLDDRPYRIRLEVNTPRALAAVLIARPSVVAAEVTGDAELEVTTTDLDMASTEIPALALQHGMTLQSFSSPDADLESLYRYLVES
ncbi:MAG: ABC transporter ATP-binding protein [Myxococcota bacterium]